MTYTFSDLMEVLMRQDEVTVLEALDISTEEILERFSDYVEENFDNLIEEFGEELEESKFH